ncbi:hypothetical protein ABK040_012435 [Willaertia magna]
MFDNLFKKSHQQYLCLYGGKESSYDSSAGTLLDKFFNLFRLTTLTNNDTAESTTELFELHYNTSLEYNNLQIHSFYFLYFTKEEWFTNWLKEYQKLIFILNNNDNEKLKCCEIFKIINNSCNLNIPVLILFSKESSESIIDDIFIKSAEKHLKGREYHFEMVDLEKDKNRIYELFEWFFNLP